MSDIPFREAGRRTPAKGVHVSLGGPNWIFLTICADRARVKCVTREILWQGD